MKTISRVCLIGFGEVGQVLAADLIARGLSELSAWDVQFTDPESIPSSALALHRVRRGNDASDAVQGAQLVISAVTAGRDIEAAITTAAVIGSGTFFVDLNSVSPGTKRSAGQILEAAGARYVEAAVMSPIAPKRIASPILLGGPNARSFLPLAHGLGFAGAELYSEELGRASAAKMCRSVMIKGMEALLTESLLAARQHGVEHTVLESLSGMFPSVDWRSVAVYMISRSLMHGKRRAEEMREVALTVGEAGIDPWMSAACVARHDWAANHRDAAALGQLEPMLDAMLASAMADDDTVQQPHLVVDAQTANDYPEGRASNSRASGHTTGGEQ